MDLNSLKKPSNIYVTEYKGSTDIPLRKILVSNLDRRTTCADLRSLFSEYGCVEECSIYTNVWNISIAYIVFENEEGAIRAVTENNTILYNVRLRVRPAGYLQQPDNLEQLLLTSDRLNKIQNSPRNSYNFDDLWNDVDKPSLNVLNDDCLKHIFSFLPIIDKIHVEIVCKRWKGLSQDSWSTMRTLDFLPSTWGLSERDIISISSAALHNVLSRCGKSLREMNLKGDPDFRKKSNLVYSSIPVCLTIDTLSEFGERCPNLKKLDTSALMMTARGLNILMSTYPNLTTIILRSWVDIEHIELSLQTFFEKFAQLEHFQISESEFTGNCLLFLSRETIHTFIIDGCTVVDQYLAQALKRLTNLRDLRIMNCHNVHKLTIYVINNHCTNLRILKLKYLYQVPMKEFCTTKLINLEALSIRYNCHLTNNILSNIVRRCSKLTKINVKDCPVTNETIQYLQQRYNIPIKSKYFDIVMYVDIFEDHN